MKAFTLSTMAWKYFKSHFRRYIFLLVALSFGFGVISFLTSLRAGMEANVYETAQSHYSGDVIIQGDYNRSRTKDRITNPDDVENTILGSDVDVKQIIRRTILPGGTLYFNGIDILQKYVIGVEWDSEKDYFDGLAYTSKQNDAFCSGGIVISAPVAMSANVKLGDRMILEVKTKMGQVNTQSFIVQGIVDDSSIFGYYKCYLTLSDLNELILFEEDECSVLGVFLKDSRNTEASASKIHQLLSKSMNTAALVSNRDELLVERKKSWDGIRLFIITLSVYLSEIDDMLLAIGLVSYFLYILMLLIIIVSVMVTYRLILHEREKELGTMQAIAFSKSEIVLMLLMEMVYLYLFSILLGYALSHIAVWGASFLSFSWLPSFEIFMKNGKLTAQFDIRTTLLNCIIVFLALLPSVVFPVYNVTKQPLTEVLSGGK